MRKVLTSVFYNRNTLAVAEELIGKFLVRSTRGREVSFMIMETEAYDGFDDRASHAGCSRKTARNAPMFGSPGHWYVYFTYGMHFMLNIVTREKDYPAAVLIRRVESASQRIDGPARLTKALGIDRKLNAARAWRASGLWIEDRGVVVSPRRIQKTPRVGVAYAGPIWANKRWRFILKH